MVSVDEAVIARIRKENTDFEILVDPEKALEFKKGKPYSIENILAANIIFTDSKKVNVHHPATLLKHSKQQTS